MGTLITRKTGETLADCQRLGIPPNARISRERLEIADPPGAMAPGSRKKKTRKPQCACPSPSANADR
jgi:hypothetical protein